VVKNGRITYGKKSYSALFLPGVKSIGKETLLKIYDFVNQGGQVFCIDGYPIKSLGFLDMERRDQEISDLINKIVSLNKRFYNLEKPKDNKFLEWYTNLQREYGIAHYVKISSPDRFFMQNRYIRDDKSEFFFFQNAHKNRVHQTKITFDKSIIKGKNAWVWDAEDSSRKKLVLDKNGSFEYAFGPTESMLVVMDNNKEKGEIFKPLKAFGNDSIRLSDRWDVELKHSFTKESKKIFLPELKDFKDDAELMYFAGTAIYTKKVKLSPHANLCLNLGEVSGISEVFING